MLTGRVRFGPFEADVASGQLRRDGALVPLQDLPFRLLAALLERPGEVVTRAELTARLWGEATFIDSTAGLNTAVAKLREALEDRAEQSAYIETIPKRGYRFIGQIEPIREPAMPSDTRTAYRWRRLAAAAVVVSMVSFAAYRLLAEGAPVRVAVVLFDNETGDRARARLVQALTDATVTELTSDGRLAVIGNAAILRTERPFRDIQAIRDTLHADYIVIGQVQARDGDTIVRAHLIRAQDQSHIWVGVATLTGAGEAALQSDVAGRVRMAIDRAVTRGAKGSDR